MAKTGDWREYLVTHTHRNGDVADVQWMLADSPDDAIAEALTCGLRNPCLVRNARGIPACRITLKAG